MAVRDWLRRYWRALLGYWDVESPSVTFTPELFMRPAIDKGAQGLVDRLNAAVEEKARELAEQAHTDSQDGGYRARHDGTQDQVGPDYEPRPWKWETATLPAVAAGIANRLVAPVAGLYRITASPRVPVRTVELHGLPDTTRPAPAGAGPSPSFFDPWIVPS